ncbi:hypothetical protein KKC60_03840 [Patescibacteria group bacterium]|nr:hypothetical protein [Patescibacteria group bacterium]
MDKEKQIPQNEIEGKGSKERRSWKELLPTPVGQYLRDAKGKGDVVDEKEIQGLSDMIVDLSEGDFNFAGGINSEQDIQNAQEMAREALQSLGLEGISYENGAELSFTWSHGELEKVANKSRQPLDEKLDSIKGKKKYWTEKDGLKEEERLPLLVTNTDWNAHCDLRRKLDGAIKQGIGEIDYPYPEEIVLNGILILEGRKNKGLEMLTELHKQFGVAIVGLEKNEENGQVEVTLYTPSKNEVSSWQQETEGALFST